MLFQVPIELLEFHHITHLESVKETREIWSIVLLKNEKEKHKIVTFASWEEDDISMDDEESWYPRAWEASNARLKVTCNHDIL